MRLFQEPDPDYGREFLTFAAGAVGGLAIGVLVSRAVRSREQAAPSGFGDRLRTRAQGLARRLRPARLRRAGRGAPELTRLEDAVLAVFLDDPVLSERPIDVGALSPGIIELSGSVWTDDEADHAVHVANGVDGVQTVVNRLDLDDERRHLESTRRRFVDGDPALQETQWSGRNIGMSRRRQGRQTDPDRPDDSQLQAEEALRDADVDQWEEEGIAWEQGPVLPRRREHARADRPSPFGRNVEPQDPHGRHAARTHDDQPQELNTSARVGEGLKPAERLRLEQADTEQPQEPGGEEDGGR